MTTVRYEAIDEIVQTLQAVRSRRWSLRLLAGALATVAVTGGALLVGAAITGYWPGQPPAALRWAVLVCVLAAAGSSVVWFLLRAAVWRQNLAQTARFVEGRLPTLRNDLINSVLLARDRDQTSPELVRQAIEEAAARARGVDAGASIPTLPLKRWSIAAGAVVALLAAFAIAQPGRFGRGFLGFVPGQYLPTPNTLELLHLSPRDAKVFAGTPIVIEANIRNPDGNEYEARVILRGGEPRPMDASPDFARFTCALGPQDQTLEYAVQIGASRWPQDREFYRITVVNRIAVESISIRYEYPPYTGLPPRDVPKAASGDIEAPAGSRATVTVRLSEAVPAAQVEIRPSAISGRPETVEGRSRSLQPLSPGSDGRTFTPVLPVDPPDARGAAQGSQAGKYGGYRLAFLDDSRRVLLQLPEAAGGAAPAAANGSGEAARIRQEGFYLITALPDDPPKAEFLVPARDATAAPGGALATKLHVSDKYGLTKVEFYGGKENQPPRLLHTYPLSGKNDETLDYTLPLEGFVQGDVLVCFAAATDNRNLPGLGPQTAESGKFKVLVQDPNAAAREAARRLEEIRKRLLAILKLQEVQRVNTEICRRRHTELAQVKAGGAEIVAGQKNIKAQLLDLIQNVPFEGDLVTIQQAVALLAQNEAQLAVDQAGFLEKLPQFEDRETIGGVLASTQDRIIAALQDLLAILPSLSGQRLGEAKTGPRADLPPEVKEKLKDLSEDLKKFMDEQRKAVEASKGLAKKPVDAFTAEDEKVLAELKALQDKWEKFLEEALSDFSKLSQQDFSNPQLLKELLSVKSDVTMAKDALAKKAVEIATAVEDNGIENAKELTANIEKWLPDVPDREQWKMENPTDETQMKTEQPNLPSELEDLVGDLLEQEEDLFEEMADQTGKYNMSGDKGIGWDALDGPISNMNAQGVTGNQLPNPNEMSGRSGEGRQGKSSGEFVEDKAVGKGGRRTPTRLTPEPFQKGEINDQSTEPAGGSTGGGKLSGSGGEGLEGPVPPPLAKEMGRLAGKQADLISRGRKFLENYKQGDYAGFKLLQTITLLDKVRDDLESGRYQNALRQRPAVMEALSQTKLALTKDVKVTADTSAAMPKYIQDGINDAKAGKIPEEFRDVLEEYYKRLSENK